MIQILNKISLTIPTSKILYNTISLNISINMGKLKKLQNNMNKEINNQITNYSNIEILIIHIKIYTLQYNLINIKNLFYSFWKEYNHDIFLRYLIYYIL